MSITDILFEDAEKILQTVDFKPLDGSTILITGSTGLIGTNLLATLCLLKETGYDLNIYGQYHSAPGDHTLELAKRGKIDLIQNLPDGADVIIHAAGYAQPMKFTANPALTISLNTAGTEKLFEILNPEGTFLFISSSEVYSGLNKWSANEDDIGTTTPYHPRSCYIEGKRCGEAITYAYRQAGAKAVSARLSLAYGPGVRVGDQRAMSQFIDQAVTKGCIDMKFAGRELRTYCYIRDAVEILWRIVLQGNYPVYNVGGESNTTITELVSTIAGLTGSSFSAPGFDKELAGSPQSVGMDLSRIKDQFGKRDFVSLVEGLERTIEWHRGLCSE